MKMTLQSSYKVNDKIGRITNLGSSSRANAFLIEIKLNNGETFLLGIECGFKYNEYLEKLYENEYDLKDIDAVLISHSHEDHSRAVKELHQRGVKIYAPQTVFDEYGITNYKPSQVFSEEYTNKYIHDEIKVFGFPLLHADGNDQNVYNLGYVITIDNDFRILFVIDTKIIKQDLTKYRFNIIFIETNFISRNIKYAFETAKKENDRGNITRYNRLYASHLALEHASYILFGNEKKKIKGFDLSRCELIIQTHISSNYSANAQYYKHYFEIKKPKHTKILTSLANGGFI